MGSVGAPVIRRIVQVAQGPDRPEDLLASVGLSPEAEGPAWAGGFVEEDAYYGLLERVAGDHDPELPLRYGDALVVDDVGALGLAIKTAPTLGAALARLVRYILVLSDTLDYELVDEPGGRVFALTGRPAHRRGAALANECALAAVTSILRQAAGDPDLVPREVSFRHAAPATDAHHRAWFGCPVTFGADLDGLHLTSEQLARPTLLADAGLSAYLLAQLDELRSQTAARSLVDEVRGAVADALADGQPSKSQVARRLGMSERTLHRRLAEEGASFQDLVTATRREAAESLLRSERHSLAEVAFLSGFSDQTAFTRAFKRWTGHTPAAYREAAS
ncbi:MAG: AraC family transcriptional regulator ligand-binding domain-containing protein [Acidimicrobiales bacterium]|nr:AraC family transcriptional regulator ligand-binding domain-containing protein [Acidimicrobiales bacterium]